MDDLVQEFYAENGQHRVNIYRREGGIFYFQEEHKGKKGEHKVRPYRVRTRWGHYQNRFPRLFKAGQMPRRWWSHG